MAPQAVSRARARGRRPTTEVDAPEEDNTPSREPEAWRPPVTQDGRAPLAADAAVADDERPAGDPPVGDDDPLGGDDVSAGDIPAPDDGPFVDEGLALDGAPAARIPAERLKQLREQARRAGLSIQQRRDRRAGHEYRYSILDRETRKVVAAGIHDLDALSSELGARIRDQDPGRPVAAWAPPATEACANCGAPRTGAFRYCRSCGFDFEPSTESITQPPAAWPSPVGVPADVRSDAFRPRQRSLGPDLVPRTATTATSATVTESDPPIATEPRERGMDIAISLRWLILIGLVGGLAIGAVTAIVLSKLFGG